MNHEPRHRATPPGEYHPRPEPEEQPHAQAPGGYIDDVVEDAPTAEAARLVSELHDQHGPAFAAYLSLAGVNPYSDEIRSDFLSAYAGSYPNRDALVEGTIDSFDWVADLDRLLAGDPLLRQMVTLDRNAIWEFTAEHHDIVEREGVFYVFEPE